MKLNEANRLAENLVSKFGLPVRAIISSDPNDNSIILEPLGVHPHEGFQIKIQLGWRSIYIDLVLGKFAADFLQQVAECSFEKKILFSNIANHILAEKAVLTFKINETIVDPLNPDAWPVNWKMLTFSLRKTPLEINTEDHQLMEDLINLWTERFFGCIIALSPLEGIEDNSETTGLPEGALKKALVNRYERSRYNRTICINFHDCSCKVCDMNFGRDYGEIGDGFIHVHHVIPVSRLGSDYIINPIEDLIPVCPNCHSMLHRKDPPYTVQELRLIIGKS